MECSLVEEIKEYLEAKGYRERSIEVRVAAIKTWLVYAQNEGLDVYRITAREAEGYREYLRCAVRESGRMRYKPNTINKELSCVRLLYGYLLRMNRVYDNPFMYVERMKELKKIPGKILTEEEMGEFLDSIVVTDAKSFVFKVASEVLYASGCRIRELEEMRREDIHVEEGYMVIRDDKSRRDRIVVLSGYSGELLNIYLKYHPEEKPFWYEKNRMFNAQMNRLLSSHAKSLGMIHVSCHAFRHSAATHLLRSGADIREVQEYLGHQDISKTEIYTRVYPEDLKAIVDAVHPREGGHDAV
jgi:integrase/recombinase XerD